MIERLCVLDPQEDIFAHLVVEKLYRFRQVQRQMKNNNNELIYSATLKLKNRFIIFDVSGTTSTNKQQAIFNTQIYAKHMHEKFQSESLQGVNGLVAPPAPGSVVHGEVGVGVDLLPVRKELSVGQGAVDLVRVEADAIRTCRDAHNPEARGLDEAPRSGHGNQVTPRVEHIAVSKEGHSLFKRSLISRIKVEIDTLVLYDLNISFLNIARPVFNTSYNTALLGRPSERASCKIKNLSRQDVGIKSIASFIPKMSPQ